MHKGLALSLPRLGPSGPGTTGTRDGWDVEGVFGLLEGAFGSERLCPFRFRNVIFDIIPCEESGRFQVKAKFMGIDMERFQLHYQVGKLRWGWVVPLHLVLGAPGALSCGHLAVRLAAAAPAPCWLPRVGQTPPAQW